MKTLTLTLVLATLTTTASAQSGWNTQRLGPYTYSYGTGDNQDWRGNSQQLGNTTYEHLSGPNGERQSCTTQQLGSYAYTHCN